MPRLHTEIAAARKDFVMSMLRTDPTITWKNMNILIEGAKLPGGDISPNSFYDFRNQVVAEKEARSAKAKEAAAKRKNRVKDMVAAAEAAGLPAPVMTEAATAPIMDPEVRAAVEAPAMVAAAEVAAAA